MDNKYEIYDNAPLVETVFEIRFPAEPAIECNRDKFYEEIRGNYPRVLVPNFTQGMPIATAPYRFEREDRTSGVMLSINNIALYCKKYEGFGLFKEETMKVFIIFIELFKIKKLNRIGLRYVNVIPFTREKDIIPLKNYLNVQINLSESIPTDFKDLNMIFVSQTEGGSITTHIESVISPDQTREAIMLDFDYAKEKDLNFDSIDAYLEESHQHTKDLFEKLITGDYKKVMRGEVI
ncbi:MAG: TIGR04255 family protein [Thermodesulfobacteriota bacterium]|jgi:uncharacterized protein (TIGR04255 family)